MLPHNAGMAETRFGYRAVLPLLLLWTAATTAAAQTTPAHITVTGTGSVTAAPDTATIDAAVVTLQDTATAAVRANSEAVAALFATLAELGITESDIRTSGYYLNPRYRPDPRQDGESTLAGYELNHQVTITLREIEGIGQALDRITASGANRIGGVRFEVSEPARHLDGARRRAFADAQRKATLYAAEPE